MARSSIIVGVRDSLPCERSESRLLVWMAPVYLCTGARVQIMSTRASQVLEASHILKLYLEMRNVIIVGASPRATTGFAMIYLGTRV
jgi:hypothetical protein